MDHKAFATCPNGHRIKFGTCWFVIRNNGRKTLCDASDYVVLSPHEVQCRVCKGIYRSKKCPVCDLRIPLSEFKKLHRIT
jgi:hypothetical protein